MSAPALVGAHRDSLDVPSTVARLQQRRRAVQSASGDLEGQERPGPDALDQAAIKLTTGQRQQSPASATLVMTRDSTPVVSDVLVFARNAPSPSSWTSDSPASWIRASSRAGPATATVREGTTAPGRGPIGRRALGYRRHGRARAGAPSSGRGPDRAFLPARTAPHSATGRSPAVPAARSFVRDAPPAGR